MMGLFSVVASVLVAASGGVSGGGVAGAAEHDIAAMCSSSLEGGPRFITNIAMISVPTDIRNQKELRAKVESRAYDTMRALGLTYDQRVGCQFTDPSMEWMDGNNPAEAMIDYQRILIQAHGYKVMEVARLDSGEGTTPKAGTPPPSEHADGAPLRFFYTVGLVPTATDTRNPACMSNVVTDKELIDWKEWGAGGKAAAIAEPHKAKFIAACQRLGTLTSLGNVMVVFDRGDGSFKPTPHPTDRVVQLP